jgi:hypothetical protein
LAASGPAFAGEFCKWTDENGVVHYAEKCPDDVKSAIVDTQDNRIGSPIGEAGENTNSLLSNPSQFGKSAGQNQRYRSLPKEKLGPVPPNYVSAFLKTAGANYKVNRQTLRGNFVLFLQARENIPKGAWLEAVFPNPSDINEFDRVGTSVGPNQKVMLESPPSRDLKCWNYLVQVGVFSDSSKKKLISIHRQVIQSQVNLDLVKNSDDLVLGVTTGLCVRKDRKDFSRMSVEELEASCQKQRENLLAPQRERLIQNCVENEEKSQEHCENYYSDYGDAKRIGPGQVRPALYMNLPECVAAEEAKANEG